MKESIFMDRIRDIFSVLDIGVYKLISIFNNTIEDLTHITIISNDTLNDIAMKLYGLIALFMIFRISFSLINYIVDPDIISDKAKGGGTLIKNIIITFALIVTVPFAFDLLYEAQNAILNDHIIEKYLLNADTEKAEFTFSMSDECSGINATTSDAGDYIGLMAFKPFFQPSVEKDDKDWDAIKQLYCNADATGGTGNASVKNILANQAVYSAPHGYSIDNYYVVDYTIFLSTVIGIVIALLFLTFCFDIAVRTVKLQFLELVAPVPIISYIDPDSSKNGMFKKWIKEVMNTWLSLFLRLAAIDFAIYIIGMLADIDLAGNNLWLKLLIIIGVLIFAKQLPKLLENIFGIKLGENFTLNPLKKISKEAAGLTAATGIAGGALAAGLGVADAIKNGNGFRDIASNISKGYAGGKKNPIKGLTSGMTFSNKMRTDRQDAKRSIAETNDFLKKGENLFNKSLFQKEDGSFDSNPAPLFGNQEYRNSYLDVETKKKENTAAADVFREANNAYSANFNSQEVEKAQAAYVRAINSGDESQKSSAKRILEEATTTRERLKEAASSAEKKSKAAQSRLDYTKEKHGQMQKIYTKDAEIEKAIDAFKKTNPDKVDAAKQPRQTQTHEATVDDYTSGESYSEQTSTTSYEDDHSTIGSDGNKYESDYSFDHPTRLNGVEVDQYGNPKK